MKLVKKIKLIINKSEKETFDFWLRRCKVLYNVCLDEKKFYYQATGKSLSLYEQKKELVGLKDMDKSWKDIPCKALQEIIFRVNESFNNLFRGAGYPKYKNNDTFNSIEFVKTDIKVKDNLVYLPKIKRGFTGTEEFPLQYSSVRLLKENDCYFLCFVTDYIIPFKPEINNNVVGCDLGLKTLMTDSNGYEVKRFSTKLIKKYEQRIKDLNKSLGTKKRGSKRYKKVKKQLKKAYLRLKNTRKDYLHKESTKYINQVEEDIIVIGKLTVQKLMKKDKTKKQKNFSKSYGNAAINIFTGFIEYKAKKNNKETHIVGEEYTSKTCSCCGTVKHDLKISDRIFNCSSCGLKIPRDVNGGINIRKVHLKTFQPIGVDLNEVKRKHRLLNNGSVRATIDNTMVCSI
jgi:putative transposase